MWSFLANLGSGLGKIGSGFAHGAGAVGKGIGQGVRGIGRGFKRLGQMGEEDMAPGGGHPGMTPPINPNAGYPGMMSVRGVEDAVAMAENEARADFAPGPTPLPSLPARPELPDLPINRNPINIPAPTPAPSLNDLRSPLPNLPTTRRPVPSPAAAPMAVPDLIPDMDLDRRNVPIPQLPGKRGAPIPYNTIDAAKYDSVMSHAMPGGGFKRDLGMTLKNAFLGGAVAARSAGPGQDPLGAAIGGALAAGAGSATKPQAGYEFAFDYGERPKLEAEIARSRAEQDRQRIERAAAMDEALKQADVDRIPLETEAERVKIEGTRAQTEIARQNAKRQDALTQSQITLNQARAEAAKTGQPKVVDRVNPETNAVETVLVFPSGEELVIGGSAKAAINKSTILSREKIAAERNQSNERQTGMQQGGANARNAATISGAKDRTQMRIDAQGQGGQGQSKLKKQGSQGGQTADMSKLREFYKKKGVTDDAEIRRRATKLGYTVKD